jgi:hypothetical protein
MTEQDWTYCIDPGAMERFLQQKTSARKARLYACACCRHIWEVMTDARSRHAVEVAEAYADGRATAEQLRLAHTGADEAAFNYIYDVLNMAEIASSDHLELSGYIAATAANHAPGDNLVPYCDFLRCIYGNPFRHQEVGRQAGEWRRGAVWHLARAVDQLADFTILPILADALEDVGCTDPEVLGHCRGIGPHVRGCWVIDLLLDKE